MCSDLWKRRSPRPVLQCTGHPQGSPLSLTGQDLTGRVRRLSAGRLFVICGFEHSIANMFYIPAGLFARSIPRYAELAARAGLDLTALTWENFLLRNLLPVTLGNILGSMAVAPLLLCHLRGKSG